MKYGILSLLLFSFGGCANNTTGPSPSQGSHFFSFENDMEGWSTTGTDLDNPPVEWSIQRSQDRAQDGNTAVKFYLSNLNDAGKIWIERPFIVEPNRQYRVGVSYWFASTDFGSVNLWRIITGVTPQRPRSRDELSYQGDTGNSAEPNSGFRWLEKSYSFNVTSGSDRMLYVVIGIWGTTEFSRTYYFDSIQITFTKSS